MQKIILASHNQGKLFELKEKLAPFVCELATASDFNLTDPEETGMTFEDNALFKARYVARETGFPALADDSGLCVNALHGEPGIFSARWAGKHKNFQDAMHKLLKKLEPFQDRSAYFICVLALALPDGRHYFFEGRVYGAIAKIPSGTKGFGYDPLFIPDGYKISFAEMKDEKKKMSHRAIALQKLIHKLPEIL